jgi:hypothetical protein
LIIAGVILALCALLYLWLRHHLRRLDAELRELNQREIVDRLRPYNGRITVYPVDCPIKDDDASL